MQKLWSWTSQYPVSQVFCRMINFSKHYGGVSVSTFPVLAWFGGPSIPLLRTGNPIPIIFPFFFVQSTDADGQAHTVTRLRLHRSGLLLHIALCKSDKYVSNGTIPRMIYNLPVAIEISVGSARDEFQSNNSAFAKYYVLSFMRIDSFSPLTTGYCIRKKAYLF